MKIGLFPLNIVLFPESVLPLHIFEERYRKLINENLDEGKMFGINLTSGQKVNQVGCTAEVESVLNKYPDGKLDITIVGKRRYILKNQSEQLDSYVVGEIEFLDEADEVLDKTLLEECVELFNYITSNIPVFRVLKISSHQLEGRFASYFFAQKAGLILNQKQVLLEMNSENRRLEYIKQHLLKIKPTISKEIELDKIIRNDGYIAPKNL